MLLNNLEYDKKVVLNEFVNSSGEKQWIYLFKTSNSYNFKDSYFIQSVVCHNGLKITQGYIYFYLDFVEKTSTFIGEFVKDEYRGQGIASYLVATWIDFCLNSGFNFLGTNRKQRKPFLIYLLKTYGFEIFDKRLYKALPSIIHVCRDFNTPDKYLIFTNPKQKETFMRGKMMTSDNYKVIDQLTDRIHYLDSVILSKTYLLENQRKSEQKTELVLHRKF